jgi:subtilisin family serine protease
MRKKTNGLTFKYILVSFLLILAGIILLISIRQSTYQSNKAAYTIAVYPVNLGELIKTKPLLTTVNLRMNYQLEGNLTDTQEMNQEQRIKQLKEYVTTTLQGTDYQIGYISESMPSLTITLSLQAFERLLSIPQYIDSIIAAPEDTESDLISIKADDSVNIGTRTHPSVTGKNAIIAVLESGFETNNILLRNKIVQEVCFRDCPNGTQFQIGQGSASVACPYEYPNCYHGTSISSVIAGAKTQFSLSTTTTEISGVAPDTRILAIRYGYLTPECFQPNMNPACRTRSNIVDATEALQWIIDNRNTYNIVGINMSNSGAPLSPVATTYCDNNPTLQAYVQAIQTLKSYNIPLVVSAGNDREVGTMRDRVCPSDVIPVGAIEASRSGSLFYPIVTSYSNVPYVHQHLLFAKGTLYTPKQFNTDSPLIWGGLNIRPNTGTSFAAPVVTGLLALLYEANPNLTFDQKLNLLKQTSDPVTPVTADPIRQPYKKAHGGKALSSLINTATPIPTRTPTPQSPGLTSTPSQSVPVSQVGGLCWNEVIPIYNQTPPNLMAILGYQWIDRCAKVPLSQRTSSCQPATELLNTQELTGYQQWLNLGSPPIIQTDCPQRTVSHTGATPTVKPINCSNEVIKSPPYYWCDLSEELRGFLEILYINVNTFKRPTNFQHLLKGLN